MYQKSAAVVVVKDGKVLFVPHKKFGPSVPGGKIEEGETFEQGARREVLEETGVSIGVLNHLFDHYDGAFWCRLFWAPPTAQPAIEAENPAAYCEPHELLTEASAWRAAYIEAFTQIGLKIEKPRSDGAWVTTFSGRMIHPLNMSVEDICSIDIAHGLSLRNRWNCASKRPYCVAEHTMRGAEVAAIYCMERYGTRLIDTVRKYFYVHDGTEAYLPDVPSPVKPTLVGFKQIELDLAGKIHAKYRLQWPLPLEVEECVTYADVVMRDFEAESQGLFDQPRKWHKSGLPKSAAVRAAVGVDFGLPPWQHWRDQLSKALEGI